MPLLKHAKKKQRQDKIRTIANAKLEKMFKLLIKKAKANPTQETVAVAYKHIDKAAKKYIIHTNKAGHLKSDLAKALVAGAPTAPVKKTNAKKTTKKAAAKKLTVKKATAAKNSPKKK